MTACINILSISILAALISLMTGVLAKTIASKLAKKRT